MEEEVLMNGGLLYHEVQESTRLSAVHCINTLLQGPYFSEADLDAIASDLAKTERRLMNHEGWRPDSLMEEDSRDAFTDDIFGIQVLTKALGVWDLQVTFSNSTAAEASNCNPEQETAFICQLLNHWFCIRKVNKEWYNFNSLYAAPEHLSKVYVSDFLETLRHEAWSIFVVRGNFPGECPFSYDNGFGQWLTPKDAVMLHDKVQSPGHGGIYTYALPPKFDCSSGLVDEEIGLSVQEEHDMNAAIAASLEDSSSVATESGNTCVSKDTTAASLATEVLEKAEEVDTVEKAAGVIASSPREALGSDQMTESGNTCVGKDTTAASPATEADVGSPQKAKRD